jgi:C4-dicarboxylate transporter DctQ subunit
MLTKINKSKRVAQEKGNPFIRLLENFDQFLSQSALFLGSVLVLATIAIVFYSVFMRYLINIPQTWTDELVGYFLVSTVMFGVAETLRRNNHVTVDLISSKFSFKHQRYVSLWGMCSVILVSVAMFFSSYQMVAFSYSVDLISDGYVEVPMWIPQSSLLIGYGLLTLSAFNRLIHIYLGSNSGNGTKVI